MLKNGPSIKVENVVASVNLNQSIDLPSIVKVLPRNVEYKPEHFPGLVFRLKKPKATFLIFSSGKMVCTGARSENSARRAVRKVINELKANGILIVATPDVHIQNIVASGNLGGEIDLERSAFALRRSVYEPELFPGLIHRMDSPKVVILIFSTGKLVCAGAKKWEEVGKAVERLKTRLEEENLIYCK